MFVSHYANHIFKCRFGEIS